MPEKTNSAFLFRLLSLVRDRTAVQDILPPAACLQKLADSILSTCRHDIFMRFLEARPFTEFCGSSPLGCPALFQTSLEFILPFAPDAIFPAPLTLGRQRVEER